MTDTENILSVNSDPEELERENDLERSEEIVVVNSSNTELVGFWAVVFLTVNATLGAGMLNIPYSFNEFGGIWYASLFQIVSIFVCLSNLDELNLFSFSFMF